MNRNKFISQFFAGAMLLAAVLLAVSTTALAGVGKNKNKTAKQIELWQQIEQSRFKSRPENITSADKFKVFRVDRFQLNEILSKAQLEFTENARQGKTILEIPTPEGNIVRFSIEESPMLAPDVAAQYPTWKQYSGQGIDDPTATARFDVNDLGFHGYVIGKNGTFLIDPYSLSDQKNYIVYYKGDVGSSDRENFSCKVQDRTNNSEISFSSAPAAFSNGTTLRNFRLAISATKEYTNFFGGNQNNAFAAVQTTVNRMITVYRRELATTFTLVSDTRTIFTNAGDGGFPAASDPNVADASLSKNQTVLDTTYGSGNYDIGHVLSRTPNPNGLAASPSLCDATAKAQGFTGAPTPQGDGFDVDYVAHEIGHQFSMSHTFNNDMDGSCGTRAADSAFEPASGVTIMGYGGICAPRNLAANSIEYFNLRSFDQALAYLQNEVPNQYPTCGTNTATGNAPPNVTVASASYNVPKQTPFTLTASATDPNGDPLTYSWEEFDLGMATRSTGAVDTDEDGNARPIFRAYNPSASGSRTFPSLYYILNNANTPPLTYKGALPFAPSSTANGYVCAGGEDCVTGERLPSISRTMNFRVVVRDNNANGGGIKDASVSVVVNAAAGPFQVTTQNSTTPNFNESFAVPSPTWQSGTTQTVTWNVANTNVAPISATNVNILLSTDGGQTFPITLKSNTPNDGSEQITVPNNATTQARIKIEAVGNIFFDINNADFTIVLAPTAASVSVSGRVLSARGSVISGAAVTLIDQNGFTRTARTNTSGYYRFNDLDAGQSYVFTISHKRYKFSSKAITVGENLSELDFFAEK